jgi:hypothetical protein
VGRFDECKDALRCGRGVDIGCAGGHILGCGRCTSATPNEEEDEDEDEDEEEDEEEVEEVEGSRVSPPKEGTADTHVDESASVDGRCAVVECTE